MSKIPSKEEYDKAKEIVNLYEESHKAIILLKIDTILLDFLKQHQDIIKSVFLEIKEPEDHYCKDYYRIILKKYSVKNQVKIYDFYDLYEDINLDLRSKVILIIYDRKFEVNFLNNESYKKIELN